MNKIAGIVCVFGGLVAIIINSQVLATVMLMNGIIMAIWYHKDGK
ncbi:MAG: hypothetical protein WC503_01135 [Candidatus Shapirobacteria bacterium]